jgi:hypothetical protein
MNYWIFKVNPEDYDIDSHIAYHDKRITWRTPNHQNKIKANDIAFIWRTGASRGIIGVMDIDSNPTMRRVFEHEKQFIKQNIPLADVMVSGKLRDIKVNLPYQVLKEMPQTNDLSVFTTSSKKEFSVGTNYTVTKEEGEVLMQIIDSLVIMPVLYK